MVDTDQKNLFVINGYISRIKNIDRVFYLACPNDKCRKKVTLDGSSYRCENCNMSYETCRATYMFSAKVSDFTESLFVNFSQDQGEAIIGMPAELFKSKEEQWTPEEKQDFFD